MDRRSLKLSGFCHSCSLIRPLDKIFFSHRSLQPDLDEKLSRAEFFQNVDVLKEIASDNCLADNNFKYSWHTKETPVSRTFVEWKTMETSMEDGLLGRAAVSRTSTEHTPWEMSRTHADSSDNFSQFDSFNYGSRQDYRRRLRKASMIKELKAATSMKCSAPDFFEGISSISFPQNRNRRDWNGELFDRDLTLIQDAPENRQIEERDRELTNANSIVPLGFQGGLEPTTKETSNIVEISCVERSVADDLTKKFRNATSFLPCQESEAELINSEIEAEEHYRRHRRFPPPLTSLRKTSSLLPHKVPLLLLQPIRSKGRLILQEVQVTSQMVFQPIRKDGRLQLRLFRNVDKSTEQNNSSSKSADIGLMTAELRPNLEMNLVKGVTDVGDGGEQSTQIDQNEETESVPSTERILAEDLAPKETESVPSTAEVSAEDFESVPSTAEVSAKDFESVPSTAEVSAEDFAQEETKSVQATAEKWTEDSAPAETKPVQEVLPNFKFQKLGSGHLGVLQTMQQILFQTIQHLYDQEYQNELIRSFAARALKLTLCRAALRNAEKKSTTDCTNSPNIISQTRVNSVDIQCVNNYEASLNSELDPNDSNPKLFHISHMLDTQDPSMQQCRYKGNRRQADEGLNAMWEAHCIAT